MTRTETTVSHETAIAIAWLKECKHALEMGRPIYKLSDRFDAIVSEWEEEGILRENHRKLNLNEAKKAAVSRLKLNPKWKIVADHWIDKGKSPNPPPHKGSVRRELKKCPDFWFALGSRNIHPKTAEKLERLGLMEKRFSIYGTSVSRTYDWRLTERGIMERDRHEV